MKDFNQASVLTAIKSPFDTEGQLDLIAFDQLVQKQIDAGIDGLIIGGTTGEGHLLDWEEHVMLIGHTVKQFGDQIIVVGNTGSNNTKEAFTATQHGFATGMHCALQVNPYYGKTSDAGLIAHFQKLLELGPAIVYNVPGRTSQDITPEVIEQLSNHRNFVGIKECAGIDRIKSYGPQHVSCWSGNDDQAYESRHQGGGRGVISVTSNLLPTVMKRLMETEDNALNERLTPLFDWLFCEPNPISLNTALAMLGWVKPVFRLPYVPLSKEQRIQGAKVLMDLKDLGGWDDVQVLEDSDFIIL